jgi:hypothetical protein
VARDQFIHAAQCEIDRRVANKASTLAGLPAEHRRGGHEAAVRTHQYASPDRADLEVLENCDRCQPRFHPDSDGRASRVTLTVERCGCLSDRPSWQSARTASRTPDPAGSAAAAEPPPWIGEDL